jgi:MFS family permease
LGSAIVTDLTALGVDFEPMPEPDGPASQSSLPRSHQLLESTISIVITFLTFALLTTGLFVLFVQGSVSGTAAQTSHDGLGDSVLLFEIPTIVIAVVLIVILGFPVNYVIGRATDGLPSVVRIALNYGTGWLIAVLIFGLLSLAIASSPPVPWNVFVVDNVLGIGPGLCAATGTALAHAIVSPLRNASQRKES